MACYSGYHRARIRSVRHAEHRFVAKNTFAKSLCSASPSATCCGSAWLSWLRGCKAMSAPMFELEGPPTWGDFGQILFSGYPVGETDGKIKLMRTGPFMPPITFPSSHC